MVGLFVVHPKAAWDPPVDRDFALILQEWAILPGSTIHNTMSMEFNLFTVNGRAFGRDVEEPRIHAHVVVGQRQVFHVHHRLGKTRGHE